MQCRVCGEKTVLLEVIDDCRYEHNFLSTTPFKANTKELEIYQCPACTHIQAEYILPDDYYETYTIFGGASQYYEALNLTDSKISKLHKYALSNVRIFDIGCGTGTGLKVASQYFENCIGIEPSKLHSDLAKEAGLNVVHAYFDKQLDIGKGYSAFMNFQVFEHLHDFYPILEHAYDMLEPGGVGLINVPNGQRIVERSLYHQIICEHVNYFTPFSLASMLQKANFEVLEIDNVADTIELDIYFKKPKKYTGFNSTKEKQKRVLHEIINKHNSITIWGAGSKSEMYSRFIDNTSEIKHLVDSSDDKVGLYISGIDLPVELVQQNIIDDSDLIIIFAASYNKEIINTLKNTFGYEKSIVYFEGEEILFQTKAE
ncbi:bifunctional 3-demethylubiquinone-9 3-methyltransferase/ 2-octaprenyl-6-hydroxy phenol methylase [compost metagenome]